MKQALKTVIELNELLPIGTDSSFWYNANHTTDGISLNVWTEYSFGEIHLWNDQNSQRVYFEETNEYEPLENTILREIDNLINELNHIKKSLTGK